MNYSYGEICEMYQKCTENCGSESEICVSCPQNCYQPEMIAFRESLKTEQRIESPKKTWKIPVCWAMMGTVTVEADSLEEAIEIARDDEGAIPIPDNGSYLEGSWEVDCLDVDYLREFYNGNQQDN